MKINPIIQKNFINKNGFKLNNRNNYPVEKHNKLERIPKCDVVSFKSRMPADINKILDNVNTAKSLEFAKNLMQELSNLGICSFQVLAKVANKQFPNIAVKPIQELAKIIPNAEVYRAYSSSDIDSAFKRIDINMYIGLPKTIREIPEFISDASHEYTHISQNFNDIEDINLLKEISKGNRNVAETLRGIYESTFRVFDTNALQYVPIVKEKEGNKLIDSHVNSLISQFLEQIRNEDDPTHIYNILEAYSNHTDLISDVKRYSAIKAKQEKEAYATEYALVNALGLNDGFAKRQVVEFFSNLEDAFNGK